LELNRSQSPNLNAYAERFVRTIKESCLEQMIFFGEDALRNTIRISSRIITWSGTIKALRIGFSPAQESTLRQRALCENADEWADS
jgi:hypothetical protein